MSGDGDSLTLDGGKASPVAASPRPTSMGKPIARGRSAGSTRTANVGLELTENPMANI